MPLTNAQARKAAEFHASHLFGVFHSPQVAEVHGYPAVLIEGFAGTKNPTIVKVEARENDGDKYWWIRYKARGTFVVLRPVAEAWMKEGRVALALLKDLPLIYAADGERYRSARWRKCTDSYYSAATEFSYFYTPYKCPELLASPFAEETTLYLRRKNEPDADFAVPREEVYGANGNGKLVTLYFVHGFDSTPLAGTEPSRIHRDYWKSFVALEKLLTAKFGFEQVEGLPGLREALGKEIDNLDLLSPVTLKHDSQRRYYRTYVKKEGGKIFVARSALFNTDKISSTLELHSDISSGT